VKLASVAPPNAAIDVSARAPVSATFSCPPQPGNVSAASLRLAGGFAGPLPLGFPASAPANIVRLLPSAPDASGRVPYFAGELVTGFISDALSGPFLWQFRASVRHASSGRFSDSGQAPDSGRDVALGDLDHDGDLDAITSARATGLPSTVWENDGSGVFASRGTLSAASDRSLLADLDGDGDLDVASSSILLNDGGWLFRATEGLGTPFAIGDFDGDGDQDIITGSASASAPWRLQRNDGQAHFTPVFIANDSVFDLQVGDLNNDGALDMVAIVYGGMPGVERGVVMVNDGRGLFKELGTFGVDATRSLALGDLDGDGDLDLFAGSWGAGGARNPADQVWLNDGRARFSPGETPFAGSVEIVLGDLDGDGDLDAIAGNHDPYSVTRGSPSVLLWNDGHAHFTVNGQLGGNNFSHVRLGDLDGDGDLDAFVTQWDWNLSPPNQVWMQDD